MAAVSVVVDDERETLVNVVEWNINTVEDEHQNKTTTPQRWARTIDGPSSFQTIPNSNKNPHWKHEVLFQQRHTPNRKEKGNMREHVSLKKRMTTLGAQLAVSGDC